MDNSVDPECGAGALTLRRRMVNSGYWPCCLNCICKSQKTTIDTRTNPPTKVVQFNCSKFNMRPPEEVIAVGCEYHDPDIPF